MKLTIPSLIVFAIACATQASAKATYFELARSRNPVAVTSISVQPNGEAEILLADETSSFTISASTLARAGVSAVQLATLAVGTATLAIEVRNGNIDSLTVIP